MGKAKAKTKSVSNRNNAEENDEEELSKSEQREKHLEIFLTQMKLNKDQLFRKVTPSFRREKLTKVWNDLLKYGNEEIKGK